MTCASSSHNSPPCQTGRYATNTAATSAAYHSAGCHRPEDGEAVRVRGDLRLDDMRLLIVASGFGGGLQPAGGRGNRPSLLTPHFASRNANPVARHPNP